MRTGSKGKFSFFVSGGLGFELALDAGCAGISGSRFIGLIFIVCWVVNLVDWLRNVDIFGVFKKNEL